MSSSILVVSSVLSLRTIGLRWKTGLVRCKFIAARLLTMRLKLLEDQILEWRCHYIANMNLFKIVSKSLIFGSHADGIFENWQTNLNSFVSASRHELKFLGGLLHVLLIINR